MLGVYRFPRGGGYGRLQQVLYTLEAESPIARNSHLPVLARAVIPDTARLYFPLSTWVAVPETSSINMVLNVHRNHKAY